MGQLGTILCKDAVFIMTSNLASDEIQAQTPLLRALLSKSDRHEAYMRVIGKFCRDIHPILKRSLKRDEFLGRINQMVVFLPLNKEEVCALSMIMDVPIFLMNQCFEF